MRIAYVLDSYPSLSETFIAREIAALRRRGFEIAIFAIHAGAGARPIPISLPLRAAKTILRHQPAHIWKAIGARWWQGLENRDDIAHIHAGFASHPAALAWGAAETAKLSWSFSGHARDIFVEGGDLGAKLGAARFASACTIAGVEALRAANPQCEILYAPHGLDVSACSFAPRDWQCGEVSRLVSVGRLVEKKGFDVYLEALARLRKQGFLFAATIIGDGPLRAPLQRQIARLHLGGCVRLTGALSHQETMAMMRRSHALVFSGGTARDGDRDGLPNVLLEAAAMGAAIVATRAGSVTDFAGEETAWLCALGDATALAQTIAAVFAQRRKTQDKVLAARTRVERDFDIARNIEPLATAFASVVTLRQSTP